MQAGSSQNKATGHTASRPTMHGSGGVGTEGMRIGRGVEGKRIIFPFGCGTWVVCVCDGTRAGGQTGRQVPYLLRLAVWLPCTAPEDDETGWGWRERVHNMMSFLFFLHYFLSLPVSFQAGIYIMMSLELDRQGGRGGDFFLCTAGDGFGGGDDGAIPLWYFLLFP